MANRTALKQGVTEMLFNGLIVGSESTWATLSMHVPKYRELNKVTVPEYYPQLRIDDLLQGTKKAEFMTTVDLKPGYSQLPIRNHDQQKTVIVTPFGV